MPPRLALVLAGSLLLSVLAPACGEPRPVQVAVGSEVLTGLYWEPPRRLAPAVLVLPTPGRGQEKWVPLAIRFRQEGYGVLALELPEPGRTNYDQLLAEVRAGFEFLRAQKKVDAARIGLMGAEGGAEAALRFAAAEPLARLVVLVSPGSGNGGVGLEPTVRDYGARPLLLIVSEENLGSAEAARRLAAAAQGETVVKLYSASLQGAERLAVPQPVTEDLLGFLRARL